MKDKKTLKASVFLCALSLIIGACSGILRPPMTPSQATRYNLYSQHDVVGDPDLLMGSLSSATGPSFVAY
jgi:hypothetical protein